LRAVMGRPGGFAPPTLSTPMSCSTN